MALPHETEREVALWVPRIWGLVLGCVFPVAAIFLVSSAFPETTSRDAGAEMEFVYPSDL